jgi:hypothetical protein
VDHVAVLGKFVPVCANVKKSKTSQINNLMMYLEILEKQEQAKSQIISWKEIPKIQMEINEI